MTSDFDNLMYIWKKSEEEQRFKPIAEWLADICVAEANTRKEGWNFETWKNSPYGKMVLNIYGEEALKWHFLSECHSVLDHTEEWHLEVFEPDTRFLIDAVYNLFRGREVSKQLLKRNAKRHYSKLMELLQKFGVEDGGYYIKLKGVERTE
jgi:hypothetical protein